MEHDNQRIGWAAMRAAVLMAATLALACGKDNTSGTSGGGGTGGSGPPSCDDCDGSILGGGHYTCFCDGNDNGVVDCNSTFDFCLPMCALTDSHAEVACQDMCVNPQDEPMPSEAKKTACQHYDPEGSCSSWSPGRQVRLDSGVYLVNQTFLQTLMDDPAPLWTCDGGIIEPLSSGPGFEIQNTNAGEFLHVMGLRNGDIPLTLNGLSLGNYEEVIAAYKTLVYWETTQFTLRVQRPTGIVTLEYEVI